MIITRLIGGLGNQMFQYALARSLALRAGREVLVDIAAYDTFKLFPYSLGDFNVVAGIARPEQVYFLRRAAERGVGSILARRIPALRPLQRYHVVKEKHFHFDPAVLRLRGSLYLEGYWQSEKYFADHRDVIRADFQVRSPPDAFNAEMAQRIRAAGANAVSLHIRRGDYITNPSANAFHGACEPAYYHAALEALAAHGVQPMVFVFSDDPEWARANLALQVPSTFVVQKDPARSFEDLRLMTLCSHHVIANSTFSWWGAWLGHNPHKRVVAPARWFRGSDWDTRDLIPSTWQRL